MDLDLFIDKPQSDPRLTKPDRADPVPRSLSASKSFSTSILHSLTPNPGLGFRQEFARSQSAPAGFGEFVELLAAKSTQVDHVNGRTARPTIVSR